MAENKKSFICYTDWIEIFENLSDEKAGLLIKHLFQYVNDKNPISNDPLVSIAFISIKQSLKRDLKKYEQIREKRSEIGRMGGLKSGEKRKQNEANEAIGLNSKQNEANEAVNDNVSVNVNVNEKEYNNTFLDEPEKIEKIDFISQIIDSFSEQFLKYRGVEYFISNQKIERSMAGKLLKAYKKNTKNSGKTTEQTLEELKDFFEKCMLITDPWINQNMSLTIIISKFNQILNILRNGNKQRKNEPATSETELADVFAKHFAADYPGAK